MIKTAIALLVFALPALASAQKAAGPELAIFPLENGKYIGGFVVLSTRFYIYNGVETNQTNIPLSFVRFSVNDKTIFETAKAPFYIKQDFASCSNGTYTISAVAKCTNGDEYRASVNVSVSNISAVFRAVLNGPVGPDRDVYLTGSAGVLGPVGEEWNPRGMKMRKINPTNYEAVIRVGLNESVAFEFTQGGWAVKAKQKDGNIVHRTVKITNDNQVVETFIDNWGITSGRTKAQGYFVSFTGDMTSLRIAYSHASNDTVSMRYCYDGAEFKTLQSAETQFSVFDVPAQMGKTLLFTFSGTGRTNSFEVPLPAVPYDFVFMSDIHLNGGPLFKQVLSNERPSFIVNGGDLTQTGLLASDWDAVLNQFRPVTGRYFFESTIGNHEEETPRYSAVTGLPLFYSFTYANSYFISIDNNLIIDPASKTYAWVEGELKKAAKFTFRFVFMHIPPYSNLKHGNDLLVIKYLVPLFEKYGVTAVLCGHEHGYQVSYPLLNGRKTEKGGIVYLICGGGGGGALYDLIGTGDWMRMHRKLYSYVSIHVEMSKVGFKVIDQKNAVIDQFEIVK